MIGQLAQRNSKQIMELTDLSTALTSVASEEEVPVAEVVHEAEEGALGAGEGGVGGTPVEDPHTQDLVAAAATPVPGGPGGDVDSDLPIAASPVAPTVTLGQAVVDAGLSHVGAAVGTLLGFDSYLRISEIAGMKARDVTDLSQVLGPLGPGPGDTRWFGM